MAASIIPGPRALAQQIVIALVAAVAVAWVIGHTPPLKEWLKKQEN
jgi:hypothetical protein